MVVCQTWGKLGTAAGCQCMEQAGFCIIQKGGLTSSSGQVEACWACNSSQLYSQTEPCRHPVELLISSRGSSSRQHNELGWLH